MRPQVLYCISSLIKTMIFVAFLSGNVHSQANDPQSSEKKEDIGSPSNSKVESENDRPTLTLNRALRRLVRGASKDTVPDVTNGLIRVAVFTTHSETVDLPTRQAFSARLAEQLAQQPNILILEPDRERVVLERYSKTNLPLSLDKSSALKSTSKSISLGQHLGVRYILLTEIESEGQSTYQIKFKMISVKRRTSIAHDKILIAKTELLKLQKQMVFYEKRLEATWRSAVLPGWGQLYQGNTGAAIAYMSLTAGLLIGGIWAQQQGNKAAEKYSENTQDTVFYRQTASNHYARAQMMWGALGVTWLSATLSAYLQGQDRAHLRLNFDPQQGSLNLSGAF